MSLEYIRKHYSVPAYLNDRVRYTGSSEPMEGVIVGHHAASLKVRFDNDPQEYVLHPTWEVEYLNAQQPQGGEDE